MLLLDFSDFIIERKSKFEKSLLVHQFIPLGDN